MPEGSLTRERVVEAALEIGDANGIAAVSLRRVADRLDVTPMALYRYVASKDALLDEMLDAVYGEVDVSDDPARSWWEGLRALADSVRQAFLRHPSGAAIVALRPGSGSNALRIVERLLVDLRRAGFSTEDAVRIHVSFARFLLALVTLEASMLPELSGAERQRRARQTLFDLESLPAETFPCLVEAAPFLAAPYDPDRVFANGLELLRVGIEAELAASVPTP